MIHDVVLRWVVTVLFVFSADVCVRAIAANRRSATGAVSHALHAVMAIAMVVMAWPWGAELPSRPAMLFFFAAAVWFAVVTVWPGGHRVAGGYHTVMMLAMAWMYAAMGGLSLRRGMTHDVGGQAGHAAHAGHGGHSAAAAVPSVDWVALLNWACMLGFGAAAAYWLYRLVTDPCPGIACQWAMAAGMAVMFAVML